MLNKSIRAICVLSLLTLTACDDRRASNPQPVQEVEEEKYVDVNSAIGR